MLANNTLLLRLEPQVDGAHEPDEDSLLLGQFLDFLKRQALMGEPGPRPYTATMAADDHELLAGVKVDALETA